MMIHIKIVSFTIRGAATAEKVASAFQGEHIEQYRRTVDPSLYGTTLSRFAQQAMVDCDVIIFVGAVGIAVRAVAPYLVGKTVDPAVIVTDEAGRYVVPILSGHIGGANAFAHRIADTIGAEAVITTATDINGAFAVDTWAAEQRCIIYDPENIRYISGAILREETVGLQSAFPIEGELPAQVRVTSDAQTGFTVGYRQNDSPFPHTLHIIPRIVHLGIGCRRGTSLQQIENSIKWTLSRAEIPIQSLCAIASITTKQNEAGLLAFVEKYRLPICFYTADELQTAPGVFSASDFVRRTVGVDNVCERAAALSSGNGRKLYGKTVRDGVTIALYAESFRLRFTE